MQASRGLSVVAGLWLGAAAAACGDGVSSSSFNPQSVPENKPVNELDDTEQAEFCEEAVDWAEEFLGDTLPRLLCRTQAIGAGSTASGFDVGACKAAEDECLAAPPEDEFDDDNLTCNFGDLDPECSATVGEFADCFDQAASLSKRLLKELSCESVGAGNVPNEADFQLNPACEQLLDRCGGSSNELGESGEGPGDESDGGSEG